MPSRRPTGLLLAALLAAAPLAAAAAPPISAAPTQDTFASRGDGNTSWDDAPVRGAGNVCQQQERWIDGRWRTSQNGSCVGDDRTPVVSQRVQSAPYNGFYDPEIAEVMT